MRKSGEAGAGGWKGAVRRCSGVPQCSANCSEYLSRFLFRDAYASGPHTTLDLNFRTPDRSVLAINVEEGIDGCWLLFETLLQ